MSDAKVKALAENYSLRPDTIAVSGGVAKIVFGEKVEKNADYLVNKSALADGVLKYMEGIQRVVFEEEYARPAKKQ